MQERVRLAQEEASSSVNTKQVETDAIAKKLATLNLTIKEIKPDGHCLYSAIADQLKDTSMDYTHIRKLAAEQLRIHAEDYLPFMTNDLGDMLSDDEFAVYCSKVECTAEWGGQLEVMALSKALSRQIHIVQMGSDVLKIGEDIIDPHPIMLSYHRHAYGLGEHYNSLVKQQ